MTDRKTHEIPGDKNITVSIVIPVRNRWAECRECLESIYDQSVHPNEIILVDDGSSEPMPESLQKSSAPYKMTTLRQSPSGIAASRNNGMRHATGTLILFTDSDCIFEKDCLRELVSCVSNHPADKYFQLAFVPSDRKIVWCIDGLLKKSKQLSLSDSSGYIKYIDTGGFAVRKDVIPASESLFDISHIRGSDTSLLARVISQGVLPRFVSSSIVEHHPADSLFRYISKYFRKAYYCSPARNRLGVCGNVLMNNRKRAKVLQLAWEQAGHYRNGRISFFLLLHAYALERLGRKYFDFFGMRPGTTNIFGIDAECLYESELKGRILDAAQHSQPLSFTYLTAWTLVQIHTMESFKNDLKKFDVCYADGMGVVLAALLLNFRRMCKVTANNFIMDLCQDLSQRELSVGLIGSTQAVAQKVKEELMTQNPGLHVAFCSPGFFNNSQKQTLISDLNSTKPDLIILAMGQPHQEAFALELRKHNISSVVFCVGGLFDYIAGVNATPPHFIRSYGLEWLWRLVLSPRRMWKRYVIGLPVLFLYILQEYLRRVTGYVNRGRKQ